MDPNSIFKFIKSKTDIENDYNIDTSKKKLGKGNFGFVIIGEKKDTNVKRAIKVVSKKKMKKKGVDLKLLENEARLMMDMDHPNIVRFYDVYEDSGYLYFVLEYLDGGDLFKNFIKKKNLKVNEDLIRNIFKQLIEALKYLHHKGIAHRDIKAENIMFTDSSKNSIKLIDFGVSKYFFDPKLPSKEITLRTATGSLFYISPEIALQGSKYDCKCDIWSAGVLLYIMVCGLPPFFDNNDFVVVEKVKNCEYDFEDKTWKLVSEELMDLIKNMLVLNEARFTASEVLEHKWMKKKFNEAILKLDLTTVKNFFMGSKFSRFIRKMIITMANEKTKGLEGDLFKMMDEDGDGLISKEDLIEGIENLYNYHDEELIQIIDETFENEDALISFSKFETIVSDLKNMKNYEEKIGKIYEIFDKKNKGQISVEIVEDILKKYEIVLKEDYKDDKDFFINLVKEVSGKDFITKEEFLKMSTI